MKGNRTFGTTDTLVGKGLRGFTVLHVHCALHSAGSSLLKAKTAAGYTPLDFAKTEEMCQVLSRDGADISLLQGKASITLIFFVLGFLSLASASYGSICSPLQDLGEKVVKLPVSYLNQQLRLLCT